MRVASGRTDAKLAFVAVDSTDLKTRETGLSSFTVYRSRNGGTATAYTAPTVAELSAANMPGVYVLTLDEDTTITSGVDEEEYVVHITQASMAPVTRAVELFRPKATEGNTLDVNSTGGAEVGSFQNDAITAAAIATGAIDADAIADGAIDAGAIANGAIDAATFAAGAIDAAALAADAAGEIADAVWDEDATAHQTQGTFGQAIGDPVADTNTIFKAVVTDATGATVGVDVVAVKAETASIQSDTNDIQARLPASLVSGRMDSSVGAMEANVVTASAIATGAIDADAVAADAIGASELAADAVAEIADAVWDEAASSHVTAGTFGQRLAILRANTAQAGAATTITLDASASAVDDFYNNTIILLTAGTGALQARIITDYVGSTKVATVATWATNPSSDTVFVILPFGSIPGASAPTAAEVADAVWDETLAGHLGAGSTGEALNASGAAGDPWTTTLPGSYTGSQAGNILGSTIKGKTDQLAFTSGNINANVKAVADFADSAIRLERLANAVATFVVSSGSASSVVVAPSPPDLATDTDGLKGKLLTFGTDSPTTAQLRGQSARITASTALSGGLTTLTLDPPLTRAPGLTDVGIITDGALTADTVAIKAKTDQLAFDGSGYVRAHVKAVAELGDAGSTDAAIRLNRLLHTVITGAVASGTQTSAVIAPSPASSATDTDALKGKIITFAIDTTEEIKGQSARITASTALSGGLTTLTLDPPLTRSPVVTDLAIITDGVVGAAQTGDSFARLGAPAGASVSADVAAVKAKTDLLTVGGAAGSVKADTVAIDGSADAAQLLELSARTIAWGATTTGSTTTLVNTLGVIPTMQHADQFKDRVLIFLNFTTQEPLRGQAAKILNSGDDGSLTITGLTVAPETNQLFVIV